MESLGGGSTTFFKFQNPGDTVDGIFESLAWDQPSKYGAESNIRVAAASGETVQARLSASLVSVFKAAEPRLVKGKSRVVIKFLGVKASKKDPSKTYKDYDVQAENLAPKALAAAAAALGGQVVSDSHDTGGNASFDPKSLS